MAERVVGASSLTKTVQKYQAAGAEQLAPTTLHLDHPLRGLS